MRAARSVQIESVLPAQADLISEADSLLIRRRDELHLNRPFLGARRLLVSSSARASMWVAVMWTAQHLTTTLFLLKPVEPPLS